LAASSRVGVDDILVEDIQEVMELLNDG